jgi:hypothetical protein
MRKAMHINKAALAEMTRYIHEAEDEEGRGAELSSCGTETLTSDRRRARLKRQAVYLPGSYLA